MADDSGTSNGPETPRHPHHYYGDGSGEREPCACTYPDEIAALRFFRRLYPPLLGFVGAIAVGVSVHSCALSRSYGAMERDVAGVQDKASSNSAQIEQLRAADEQIERTATEAQSRILIQLGRMEAQLSGISGRMDRFEDRLMALPAAARGGRRP